MTPDIRRARYAAASLTLLSTLSFPMTAQTPAPVADYGHSRPAPALRATRIAGRITIDGRFDEPDWNVAPVATDFRQVDPEEGALATQRTEVRILYDRDALYVGATLFDTEGAAGVRGQLARRDAAYDADWFELAFDAFHDHVRRVFLSVTPSGAKNDETAVGSACCDPGWDPVWDVATRIDERGWTSEFRIPFSQLRMPADSVQTWGLQLKRVASRINETSLWAFWGRTQAGGAPHYGHLEHLEIGDQPRHFEVLPYVVGRAKSLVPVPGDPFNAANQSDARLGADFKYLLTPNLTLTGTMNPDFGQVEVDPAVVNLSAFETFFDEKRPFFVEGVGSFRFGRTICHFCGYFQGIESFYSRRIGRAPTAPGLALSAGPYADIPEASTILGAVKLTGRTRGGVNIGVLNAVTRREDAVVQQEDGSRTRVPVEPLTNYFVSRLTSDHRGGNLVVGTYASSVWRDLPANMKSLFNSHSEMGGIDLESYWQGRRYSLLASVMGSRIAGDPAAMTARQRSSARYFQRPDGDRVVDTLATSLSGFGGYLRFAKDEGLWTWEGSVNTRSPGYEVNDIAFQSRADFIGFIGNVSRLFNTPTSWYQRVFLTLGAQYQQNYQGLSVPNQQAHLSFSAVTPQFWSVDGFLVARPSMLDDRLLRGGPSVRIPREQALSLGVATDARKQVNASAGVQFLSTGLGDRLVSSSITLHARPRPNMMFSIGPGAQSNHRELQYVTSVTDAQATAFSGRRYVLAEIHQTTAFAEARANVTLSPTLSFEVFAQPFLGAVKYSAFKEFEAPRSEQLIVYGRDVGTVTPVGGSPSAPAQYRIDPGTGPSHAFTITNPDFNQRSLRGNAVLRWEYRPGSTVYLVWTQARSQLVQDGSFALSRDVDAMLAAPPDNIFLIKASWWFSR